jgi:hypothetical protein
MKQPPLHSSEVGIAFRQRAIVNVLIPLEAQQPLEKQPDRQQEWIGVFQMKV